MGCSMVNERSWRLWLQWSVLLLPWGLRDAAAHCQGLLPAAATQDFINGDTGKLKLLVTCRLGSTLPSGVIQFAQK